MSRPFPQTAVGGILLLLVSSLPCQSLAGAMHEKKRRGLQNDDGIY